MLFFNESLFAIKKPNVSNNHTTITEMDQHRPILLTSPDGTHSIINQMKDLSLEDKQTQGKDNEQGEEPTSPNTEDTPFLDNSEPIKPTQINETGTPATPTGGVQFDSEQIQRGRSRIKRRSDFVAKNSENDSNGGSGNSSRSTSRSFSRSRSRSRSRTASRIRDEEFLKWTVLRQDPSMRLHNYKMKYSHEGKKKDEEDEDDEDEDEEESGRNDEDEDDEDDEDEDDEDEDDEDDDEEEEEESDEEQVSDIENDTSINEQFNYDLGTKVLPNFCISINEVLESSKAWIAKYETEPHDKQDDDINITNLDGGYIRGVLTLTKPHPPKAEGEQGEEASTQPDEQVKPNNDSYILYVDWTSESIYAITYVLGTLVKNGDTVYIVHWHSDRKDFVSDADITKNIVKLRNTVLHLFDCVSATIDSMDVVILSLTHPYPKHLLNEMINGLQPIALCCSLSMTLSGLQNFVCSVPTFIIRKKLKRTKKKGIFD